MKISKYNYIFEANGEYFAFNAISDRFVSISNKISQLLKSGDVNRIKGEALEILSKRKFLIPDDFDEYQSLISEYEKNIDSNVYHLTLLPTLDCNVNCWYCFEKQHEGSRLNKVISEAIVAHIKYILLHKSQIDKFVVTFFGGEPLLYFKEDVYPLLIKIQNLIKLHSKKVTFLFVTNGLELSDENIQLMKKVNVNFQISIDGYKKKHDAVKKMKSDSQISTYDRVMKNVRVLASELDTHINLRINYDNNTLHHVVEIIEDIKNIPKNKVTIHFERVWQTTKQYNLNNEELKNVFETFLQNGFSISYLNLFRRSHSCRASLKNQSVISYDGNVYKCSGRDFTSELKEGVLRTNGEIKWFPEKLHKRLSIKTYDNVKCRDCKLLPLCWGPCCQKQLEISIDEIDKKCQANSMEMPIDSYLYFRMKSEQNMLKV